MTGIFVTAAPLFLIIAFGIALRRTGVADERWTDILNRYGLYAAFPALIIKNLLDLTGSAPVSGTVMAVNFVVLNAALFGFYGIARWIKLPRSLALAYGVCGFYGNVAYLGLPFISSVVPGSAGSVTLHIAIYLIVLFSAGMLLLERAKCGNVRPTALVLGILRNPLFDAVIIGIVLFALKIKVPALLLKTLSMLGASASPAVLIGLGIFVGRGIILDRRLFHAFSLTAVKIAVLPALFIAASLLFPSSDFKVSILEAATPLGLTAFALSQMYDMDRETIAQAVIISTLLSMITLPLLAGLI